MLERNINPSTGGPVVPSLPSLKKIASGMGMTLDALFSAVDDMPITLDAPSDPLPSNVLPFPGTYKVPRIGRIACGEPITAEENIEDYDPVPNFVHADYTLVCKGDSMTGARIFDGDVVCIKQDAEVRSGDIAAVLVDGDEATLKRVRFQDNGVVLWPENPAYMPMAFLGADAQRVRIIGKATHFISAVR
jgi:repressor LexA